MKLQKLILALTAAGLSSTAFAVTDAERIAQLEKQLKAMQEQIEALKGSMTAAKPAPAAQGVATAEDVQALRDQMDAAAKETVVVGDIPGSFRVPGSDTSVRMYGIAEINMVREMKGDNRANDYSTALPFVPLNGSADAGRDGATYMHARTSRIGIEGAMPTQYGQASVKVEGDFNNDPKNGDSSISNTNYVQHYSNSYGFRLRHAYVQVGPWLAGQTWSTFMDIDNTPETVDFNGAIGSTFIRQPQVRYTYASPKLGSFFGSLENSVSLFADDGARTYATKPDVVMGWVKPYSWGSVSARAVTTEQRKDAVATMGHAYTLSGQVKTFGDDFISWIMTNGTGAGRYMVGGNGDVFNNGSIEQEKVTGLVLGYQHKPRQDLRFNVVYGGQYLNNSGDAYEAYAKTSTGINRKLTQLHIGGFWNPIKPVELGAEYIFGERETVDGQRGYMGRVNLLARYNLN